MTKQQKLLQQMERELAELAGSRSIATEEARLIIAHQRRLVEVMLYGEARTPIPQKHHG